MLIKYQTAAPQLCEGRDVEVGGDARCCSLGHSAKYGGYSLLDLESGMILAIELIQVNIFFFQIIYISFTIFLNLFCFINMKRYYWLSYK